MSANNKLHAVIRHEFLTTVKQPSFWIALVAFPLIAGIVLLIGALTDSSDKTSISPEDKSHTIVVIDDSKLINPNITTIYNIRLANAGQKDALEESVKKDEIDGLVIYPHDLVDSGKYQIFANTTEDDNAALVSELGRTVLQQSLLVPLASDKLTALALSGGESTVQSYKDGKPAREIGEHIVPGAFLVLFYIILIFSVGYALTSVSEEKENRSIEMVLSYVKPQTLILGKLFAIILVTLTQIAFIALMAVLAYGVARSLGNNLSLPFNISDLTFVPSEIFIGSGFLVFGFIFYVGLMAMIGAIFPSSKEASGFATIFYLLPAVPFWGINAVTNEPSSMFTQILTYFPLTSPTTVLTRNAAGNIGLLEGLLSLLILIIATVVIVGLAAKAFRLGTLEYSERIKLSLLFRK